MSKIIMNGYPLPPCKDCPDRFPGCHSDDCPHGWTEYAKKIEEIRQKNRDDFRRRDAIYGNRR